MKHKVSELTGSLLDAAVIKANDLSGAPYGYGKNYKPSRNWDQAGPIIQRERIAVFPHEDSWLACTTDGEHYTFDTACAKPADGIYLAGPTPQVAAMRAYCASVFGEEVNL